ncbi:GNAT family N-acetyltransferase [Fictibacillus aquaticus]|uniref:GNAT family N-acetyltransferase n=1 Tax=Fictibacillus aquaticus TaxID=2021314 RepID=UPI001F0B6516|nr:GNAT family N-acetyltransferase [Fictibacillus aquaticus]
MALIRHARTEDYPAILAIYNEAVLTSSATFDIQPLSMEERTSWFQKFSSTHPLLVFVIEGEVAGYACISPYNSKPAYSRTAEVSIYIWKKYHGKGIGKKLMKAVLKEAKSADIHTVIAGITAGNDASIRLHEGFGFRLAGTVKEVGYKFADWHDVHYYQVFL